MIKDPADLSCAVATFSTVPVKRACADFQLQLVADAAWQEESPKRDLRHPPLFEVPEILQYIFVKLIVKLFSSL